MQKATLSGSTTTPFKMAMEATLEESPEKDSITGPSCFWTWFLAPPGKGHQSPLQHCICAVR